MSQRERFVDPDTDTIPISKGDYIVLRRRLNTGERRLMFSSMYRENSHGDLCMDPAMVGISTVLAYLVDWSLKHHGKSIPIANKTRAVVVSAVDALDPDDFSEILKAVQDHERAMTAEREQEKNGQGGETPSPATSPSLDAAAGATSGSVS